MKSKDLQNIVFSEYRKDNGSTKIFRELAGELSLETIRRWCKMIDTIDSIDSVYSSGRSRIVRTPGAIGKVKTWAYTSGRVSVLKNCSSPGTSIQRILKKDLEYRSYTKRVQFFLTDAHTAERQALANWIRTNFRKEQTMRILFTDEKSFGIDRGYDLQKDRMWTPSRSETNERRELVEKRKFLQNVMVWLGAWSKV